jgi:hypothetical protein
MLQERQIVKALDKQIGIEYPICIKSDITNSHSIDWMLISVNVTIYRTVILHRYQSNRQWIMMMTTKLRSCSYNYEQHY